MRFRLMRVCKGDAMSIIPQDIVRYDLKASRDNLIKNGYEVQDLEFMQVARRKDVEITLYINGRLMISPMSDKERAKQLAETFYSLLIEEKD
ncbi:MAG TPA: hypothetical protein VLH13_04330 [Methanomassiliicoccales archaeon]|nr:hypothetical protein [Methanomassiliicoccales archaeon]